MKKILFITLVLILIGVSLISIFYIYKYKKEDYKQEKIFEEIIEIVNNNEEQKENETKENSVNIEEIYKINNDIVGWISIDNTNINYPVMQTIDRPNYYLNRNFYKEYSSLGTPYIAEHCNIEKSDNLIIYAHNIIGNKMFGELKNYKNKDYYNNHKIIKFFTKKENAEYEIISVFKTVAYTGFQYYKFYNADNKEEFDTFIKKCKELSFYDTQISAEYGEKIITLSTCEDSIKNGRLVVVAKKLM